MKGLFKRGKNGWGRFTSCPGQPQLRFSLDTPDEARAIVLARDTQQPFQQGLLHHLVGEQPAVLKTAAGSL